MAFHHLFPRFQPLLQIRPARLFPAGAILLAGLVACPQSRGQDEPESEAPVEEGATFNKDFEQKAVFTPGSFYKSYRIPSLVTTPKGTLLAFCEGRFSNSDSGRVDLLLKTSPDGGRTWSDSRIVAGGNGDTWGNPCPVVDRKTGRVWLIMCQNLGKDSLRSILAQTSQGTRTIWASHSDDDGKTWSEPKNITDSAKDPEWSWCATGPGIGIQLASGRLVIPGNFNWAATRKNGNYVIYSDDHGETWKRGEPVSPYMNEAQVVELSDGRLLLNSRPSGSIAKEDGQKHPIYNRVFSWSSDQGQTWSKPLINNGLKDSRCQGSTLSIPSSHLLLFSSPQGKGRRDLTLQTSSDDGNTWQKILKLCDGRSAYSCLTMVTPDMVGCLYEAGVNKIGPAALVLARVPLAAIKGAPKIGGLPQAGDVSNTEAPLSNPSR